MSSETEEDGEEFYDALEDSIASEMNDSGSGSGGVGTQTNSATLESQPVQLLPPPFSTAARERGEEKGSQLLQVVEKREDSGEASTLAAARERLGSLSEMQPIGPRSSDLDLSQIPTGPLAYFGEIELFTYSFFFLFHFFFSVE